MTPRLILAGLGLLAGASARANEPPAPSGPPSRIELPVIQPGCDRAGDPDTITVCAQTDRRFRIDPATLTTLRIKEQRDDPENQPRPLAVTSTCSEPGPFGCREEGVIPIGAMAFKAVELAVKAVRGEDLRPALRQRPTEYEIYQQAQAEQAEGR
jgi:hypothetical protein